MESMSLLERVKLRRKEKVYTKDEYQLIREIGRITRIHNIDNVSRTKAYKEYYKMVPEMEWALLASMVSRNAGWNMTDLKSEPIYRLISDNYLKVLFHTYERPNWLIFHDAYPQLLLYATSVKWDRPLFHLLKAFDVSLFMEMEWENYWQTHDKERLCYALIVNEQHVIQQPVIEHGFYANMVFENILFKIEEILRLNAVVFPDKLGALYGFSVTHFKEVDTRISLGKRLHTLLFKFPESEHIREFGLETEHTGARFDYECVSEPHLLSNRQSLRELFPVINHRRLVVQDWFDGKVLSHWFDTPAIKSYQLTDWYRKKRKRMSAIGECLKVFVRD